MRVGPAFGDGGTRQVNDRVDTLECARIELSAFWIPCDVGNTRDHRAPPDTQHVVPTRGEKRRELRANEA